MGDFVRSSYVMVSFQIYKQVSWIGAISANLLHTSLCCNIWSYLTLLFFKVGIGRNGDERNWIAELANDLGFDAANISNFDLYCIAIKFDTKPAALRLTEIES